MTQPRSAARTRSAKGRRAWQAAAILTAGALTALGLAAASAGASPPRGSYQQINMVSDQPGVAPLTDPDLVNAWGLSASPGTDAAPGSPLWVSDNGTDKTTLYAGASATTVTKVSTFPNGIDVTSGAPTGQVFNTDSSGLRRARRQRPLGSGGVHLRLGERRDRRLEPGSRSTRRPDRRPR